MYPCTDLPSPPPNPRVASTQPQLNSSIITLDWDPPSSTGGVSVSYVLTISPTPLSGSPVTVETTSTQITVSFNTPYSVTIIAVNCVGNASMLFTISTIGQYSTIIILDPDTYNSLSTQLPVPPSPLLLVEWSLSRPPVYLPWAPH